MGKIGDVEITKIPPGQPVECQSGCSAIATSFRNGIPYCVDCLLAEQEKAWKNEVEKLRCPMPQDHGNMTATKLRVLIVDNEPLIANSLAQIFNLYGFEATAVHNPPEALDWVATHPCDFLISDVVMAGYISGVELAFRFAKLLPNCKVLLMSGNASTAELLKAAEQKGHTFDILPKPTNPDVIMERVKSMAHV